MTRSVWQVSGSPVDRPYAEVFFEYGVALIGPGHDGPWQPGRTGVDAGCRRERACVGDDAVSGKRT